MGISFVVCFVVMSVDIFMIIYRYVICGRDFDSII